MNRTSFFGRLGAVLAAPIATPLTKALAPTSTEAPMIGRMAMGAGVIEKATADGTIYYVDTVRGVASRTPFQPPYSALGYVAE